MVLRWREHGRGASVAGASEADEHRPEGADDEERPERDVGSEGHPPQGEEDPDHDAGREGYHDQPGDRACEPGEEADRDEQLEVAEADRTRAERERHGDCLLYTSPSPRDGL